MVNIDLTIDKRPEEGDGERGAEKQSHRQVKGVHEIHVLVHKNN